MGYIAGVNFSGIGIIFLLLSDVVDGAVAGVGVLIDLAVADAPETTRAGQSGPEAADAREHIKVTNYASSPPFYNVKKKPRTSMPPANTIDCFEQSHNSKSKCLFHPAEIRDIMGE